jgi:CheY-like chemotaxis protein
MAIQGYVSLMLINIESSHPHYDKLRAVEERVVMGANLTKQLLGFARGGRYEVKAVDLNKVLKNTSTMFGQTKKEITIHKKLQEGIWAVEADTSQLEQVFLNIYVNAWQAMPGGGHLYLETDNIAVTSADTKAYHIKPGRYVRVAIADTGAGMDEKTKKRIFEPFFTTREMGRGTGIGLAMVYGIIKGHGGYINVYSEENKGTNFKIYLPATEKEVQKKEMVEQVAMRGRETILLVDDEATIVAVMTEILEALGYKVLSAGSGEEAIRIYNEKRDLIDLVILDMVMPGMGGGETFDRLKQANSGIKVILSSGYTPDGEAAGIIKRGCQGFIQKPINIHELSRKIREVL